MNLFSLFGKTIKNLATLYYSAHVSMLTQAEIVEKKHVNLGMISVHMHIKKKLTYPFKSPFVSGTL